MRKECVNFAILTVMLTVNTGLNISLDTYPNQDFHVFPQFIQENAGVSL
jgi:hypothetical protein